MSRLRCYSELSSIESFTERFKYLMLGGNVGRETFGFDRYLNQRFYRSSEWRQLRSEIITRDEGRDLGVEGYEIHSRLYIHHMNPILTSDLLNSNPDMLNPKFLITTTHQTHNAIHYGDENLLPKPLTVRRAGDTKLW